MNRKIFAALAAGLALAGGLVLPAGQAAAHHSFAMFDMQKLVTLKGTIANFKWTNPHSWIEIDVPVKSGVERWAVEMTSPNNLAREGWKRTTLKPGDAVQLAIHPLRDGGKGGTYVGVRLPDGSKLGEIK